MFQDNGNPGDIDRYCGYTPISKLEEATDDYQKSPDPSSNLHTLQPAPQGTYSLQSDSKGSPYSLHTMQPMLNQHLWDPMANFSQHTMQCQESWDPSDNMNPEESPFSQALWDLSSNFRVSEGSPFSQPIVQPMSQRRDCEASPFSQHSMQSISQENSFRHHTMQPTSKENPYWLNMLQPTSEENMYGVNTTQTSSEENSYGLNTTQPTLNCKVSNGSPYTSQLMKKTFDFESSFPVELGEEFTENLANPLRPELSYASLPYYSGPGASNWDGFFSTNENYFDDCLKDIYGRDDNEKDNEVEPKQFKNGQLDLVQPDHEKIDSRDCVKREAYDNVNDSTRTAFNKSRESDSEEEELIVIDSDTDDKEEISELYEKSVKYCEYPIKKCNTVIVSENDYRSLEYSKFLNDIIIDFYLNYIFVHILPVEHQSSVHVFSTLFYKRLLQMPSKKRKSASFEEDVSVPMAVKRHRRVSGWTKTVDLFSKSVLLIPICENSHWYLLLVVGLPSRPFILVLDSLGGLRHRAARIIRQYLACEYEAKQMERNLSFSDADIPCVHPTKPLQPNGTDCGVYLLHYAEKIFKSFQNFLSPNLPCLINWFSREEVAEKRSDIARLIRNLAREQKSDNDLQFPDIPFTLKKDPEVDDGMELDVEDVKSVDDFIKRLEHLTDQNCVKNSEVSMKIVGSEMKKTSTSKKRVVRRKIEKMKSSGDSKSAAPSTSTSRDFPLPEKNPVTQTESEAPSSYCKSYSKGFKIPRKSDGSAKQTATFLTETSQTLPTSDYSMSGTDSIVGKLNADELKFHAVPESSEMGASTGRCKSTIGAFTATSCPVYGDRCQSTYHRHPKVKNLSRKSRNGVNSTRASFDDDSNGEVPSGDIDGQCRQNWGMKKYNIVDKFLTGASKTSDV